ncbi:MAG: Na+/H+ antiporter NhaA [Gemmatimonadaceae bacterium]
MAGEPSASTPHLVSRTLRPFQEFAQTGALGGIVLLACAVVAVAWANSPWSDSYFHLWESTFTIGVGAAPLSQSLHHWINDGLMAVFFLLVGLEIKRELLVGELASVRQAALPIVAAIGGMLVPAVLYALLNGRGPGAAGWGIPMATDIAFALGVLTLLGPRIPVGLKVFLSAFAIVDDMGAVLVIALFYTSSLSIGALGTALAILAALVMLNVLNVRGIAPYLLLGVALWLALLSSGLHATIAGVMVALTIPARTRIDAEEYSMQARALIEEFDRTETGDRLVITSKGQQEAIHALDLAGADVQGPLLRLEHALHGVVAFGIMPVFALANAGVHVVGLRELATDAVAAGVVIGLVIGKPLGITLFAWAALRLGWASLPSRVTLRMIHGAAWIGGIGFTMSLFIAGLAFAGTPSLDAAKIGVIVGSLVSGTIGFILLRRERERLSVPDDGDLPA